MKAQPAICGLCPHGCWVHAHVSQGELVGLTADPDLSYGNLCERGRLAPQIVYSEDRITTPLIRTGAKGKPLFRQATWDEALDRIAEKFLEIRDAFGAHAVASYMGAGTLEDGLSDHFEKILAPFGSPNDMDCGSTCYISSRVLAPVTTLGIRGDSISPDFEHTEVIILWGTNPLKDGLPEKMRRIRKARDRGARLVVIDPRRHALARNADHWIPVLPGSDGALALSLMNVIIAENLYDRDFVERWTHGFGELSAYAASFTPERAAGICGVDAETMQWLARIVATTQGVAIDFHSGLEFAPSGVQNGRALYALVALTGNIDVPGGLHIHDYPHDPDTEYLFDGDYPPLGSREHPLFCALTGKAHVSGLASAVLDDDPYPVRGLLIAGGSPSLSYPAPETWQRIYEQLDFMAVIDRFMPEEAAWADVVLPATTYFEIDSYHTYRDHIRLRRKVIEPVGQAMNDSLILAAIADRLGCGNDFPRSEEEIIRRTFAKTPDLLERLRKGTGISVASLPERQYRKYESARLRGDGRPGFPTPSGRFEFMSALLEQYGYDPLPVYTDPRSTEIGGCLPLLLTTGARTKAKFNSQYLDRQELAVRNEPFLEINPCDADARGIGNGDMVTVMTSSGRMSFKAHVTSDIAVGTVHTPSGGGGRRQRGLWRYANVNSIVPPDRKDPISGYSACKSVMCEVSPLEICRQQETGELVARATEKKQKK